MLNTLEYFALTNSWSTKKMFLEDPAVASWENPLPGTRINVRLMRYTRAGLLHRRRTKGRYEYEYKLAPKGLDRFVFVLKDRGLLDPAKAKDPEDREKMLNRLAIVKLLLREEKARLFSKSSQDAKKETLESDESNRGVRSP